MRALTFVALLVLLPGCPSNDGAPDANAGTDAPTGGTDAPTGGTDAPTGGTDAPVGTDAPDDAPMASLEGVSCGAETCTGASDDICCNHVDGRSCSPRADCTGAPIECDGPEDCGPGEGCCGGGASPGIRCMPDAECSSRRCHVDANCPVVGDVCCALASGWGQCIPSTVCR